MDLRSLSQAAFAPRSKLPIAQLHDGQAAVNTTQRVMTGLHMITTQGKTL
jgi:hypothetical protein